MTEILTGNKGEWSEIYVFLRLLEAGKLFAADENLVKNDNVFYDVLKIFRTEAIGNLVFTENASEHTISVYLGDESRCLLTLPVDRFRSEADYLYYSIVNASRGSFAVPKTELFLNILHVNTLKAKSKDKADIHILVHDINTGFNATQGFSIKSRLGNPSTLINSSRATNFIYKINRDLSTDSIRTFNDSNEKFQTKFTKAGITLKDLEFVRLENTIFESNLMLIDGDLPKICAFLLAEYYLHGKGNIFNSVNDITDQNPFNYNLSYNHPYYEYKIKRLLSECALGMLPATVWTGKADATGGYIIVREDGEVLCYHLFNRNEFETYLLNNTKFDTPSTGRHGFGKIYCDNGIYFIKLNLQVRFIK